MSVGFGAKLKKLRKINGFSQEFLAEKLNVSRQTVSKWEYDKSEPDLDTFKTICALFHVSYDYFLDDESKDKSDSKESILENIREAQKQKRKTVIFIGGSILAVLGVLSLLLITVIDQSMKTLEYTMYRYFTVQEYVYLPPDYKVPVIIASICILAGVCIIIACKVIWKEKI